jgi:P-type conjugative transfer protein TrbG
MKKILIYTVILCMIPSIAMAADAVMGEDFADQYFSDKALTLTPQEQKALSIGQKWQTGDETSKPVAGDDGSIKFIYGNGQTQIVCAVLQVCDVALQPGEQVDNVNVGDPRFTVEPSISGDGKLQKLHLLIKPLDVGLDTSLVVTTDRRTYHFRLRSTRKQFMPFVSFIYPEDAQAKWAAIVKNHQDNTIAQTGEYLGNLSFAYKISGNTRWKPVRVYNDGVKTIIEMPAAMQQTEAPTLLVVRKDGGIFSDGQNVMVNYRLQGNRYIVDTVFDKAILIAGVGSNQDRVTITKES